MKGIKQCINYMIDNPMKELENGGRKIYFDAIRNILICKFSCSIMPEIVSDLGILKTVEWSPVKESVHFFDWEEGLIYIDSSNDLNFKREDGGIYSRRVGALQNSAWNKSKQRIDQLTDEKWYKEEVE